MTALSRGYSGYYSQRDAAANPSAAVPPRYLAPAVLKPFMSEELSSLQLIPYILPGSGAVAKGLSATKRDTRDNRGPRFGTLCPVVRG